jgi:hypothetical protein
MPYTTAFGDEPIWNESILRDMVRDTGRSAQTRNWALETLARTQGPQNGDQPGAISLAVEMLEDPEPHVAAHALTLLDEADGAECSRAVALFAERDGIPLWSRLLATVFLASCGNKNAIEQALGTEKARAYFGMWAERDPQGFADAACDAWEDERLRQDLVSDGDFLQACAIAAKPELARPLVEALVELDLHDEARDDIVLTIMGHAGFGVPELAEDMPIVWPPRDEQAFESRIDTNRLEARFDELAELVADGKWDEVSEHCLETVDLLGEMGARDMASPCLVWAFALRDALDSLRHSDSEEYQHAQLAFALQEAVMLVFDIEATLEERDGLDDALALHGWAVGSQRDRLEDVIRARWEPNDDNRETITGWLDALDDEFEWFDALGVAARLPAYNISPCLLELVDEIEGDGAGFDLDWAADALLDVLETNPRTIAANPDRLLLGDALVSDCALQALGSQPWCWASDLVLERFGQLSGTEENEILWETLAELSDPRSLERLIDYWEANPSGHRLAHAIGFVADVNGRLDELPESVNAELNELSKLEGRYQKRLEAMIDGVDDLTASLPEGERVALELECNKCETIDTFEFDELYLDHERGVDLDEPFAAILPDRVIECRHCHARDQVEATERSRRTLATMLTALIKADHWPEDAPIQVWHPELWDGTTFHSPLEGIERLKAQAEAQPDRAEPWRRLGHFCTRFHEDADAIIAYEHANSIDHQGVPDPKELRELGIPTAPLGPMEADELLDQKLSAHGLGEDETPRPQNYALHECLVSTGWREVEDLCSVFVSRKASEDRYLATAFLVDLGCQGVKEVIYASSLDADKYHDLKTRLERIHGQLDSCSPELAARILDTSVRFSLALGFFPPDDYFSARSMLAGVDPEAADEDVPTGEAGLPLYVGDPDAADPVIERLYRRTGPDGFASL